jgi:hypothetical protein
MISNVIDISKFVFCCLCDTILYLPQNDETEQIWVMRWRDLNFTGGDY